MFTSRPKYDESEVTEDKEHSLTVSTPNTIRHSRLTVCLPACLPALYSLELMSAAYRFCSGKTPSCE